MFLTETEPRSTMKAWDEVSETGRMRTGAWAATSMVRYLSHALRERERERDRERERERGRERILVRR